MALQRIIYPKVPKSTGAFLLFLLCLFVDVSFGFLFALGQPQAAGMAAVDILINNAGLAVGVSSAIEKLAFKRCFQHSVVQPHQWQCPPPLCGDSGDMGGSIYSSTSTIISSTGSSASSTRTTSTSSRTSSSTSSSTTSSVTSRAHLLLFPMM